MPKGKSAAQVASAAVSTSATVKKPESSQSADRVLRLLVYLASAGKPVGVTAAAEYLGISVAATHRLAQSLVAIDFAQQDSSRRYKVGPGALVLAQRFLASWDVRARYRPLLERVEHLSNETTCLIAAAGLQRVCVDYVVSSQPIAYLPTVGQTFPLATGAVGRALLSDRPAEERERYVSQLFNVGHERREWETKFTSGQAVGYYVAESELIKDMNGFAFPLKDSNGRVIAALSVTGPAYRLPIARLNELAGLVSPIVQEFIGL
jgi:DNA-binding IclR family transcriptional regulator